MTKNIDLRQKNCNVTDRFVFKITLRSSVAIFCLIELYALVGCSPYRKGNELTKFATFQFSFQDTANSKFFSVLFSQSDTVFLKKYLQSDSDSALYSILPDSARPIINQFVTDINSSAFLPLKPDSIEDSNPSNGRFLIYIDYPGESQQLNSYSLPVLEKFYSWVNKFVDNSKFYSINRAINFK